MNGAEEMRSTTRVGASHSGCDRDALPHIPCKQFRGIEMSAVLFLLILVPCWLSCDTRLCRLRVHDCRQQQ